MAERNALMDYVADYGPQTYPVNSLVRFTRVGDQMVGEIPRSRMLEAERLNAYGTKHEAPLADYVRGLEPEDYALALRMGRFNVLGQVGMDLQQPFYQRVKESHWPYKDRDVAGSGTVGVYEPSRNRVLVREIATYPGETLGHEMTHAGMKYMANRDYSNFLDSEARSGGRLGARVAHLLGMGSYRVVPSLYRGDDHHVMSAMDDMPMPDDVPRLMPPRYRSLYPADEESRAKAADWVAAGQQLLASARPRGPR